MTDLFVEKYRPKTIDDLLIPLDKLTFFKECIEKKDIPHLLFYGSPGLGKTALAKILAKTISPDSYLYINASDHTSVDTIRGLVKDFCSTISFGSQKIVILDESDGISESAMRMLRGTMEEFHKHSRFILTCNHYNKISDAIKSRSQEFEFGKIEKSAIAKRCFHILKQENITLKSVEDLKKLVNKCYPDIRKTINNLQKCSVNGVFEYKEESITDDSVSKLITLLKNGEITTIRKELLVEGTDFISLYGELFDRAKELVVNPDLAAEIMVVIGEYMYRHSLVIDQERNFVTCLLVLYKILK